MNVNFDILYLKMIFKKKIVNSTDDRLHFTNFSFEIILKNRQFNMILSKPYRFDDFQKKKNRQFTAVFHYLANFNVTN